MGPCKLKEKGEVMVCWLLLLVSIFWRFELRLLSLFCLNQGLGSPQISFWQTLAGYPRNSLELSNDSSFLLALLLRDFVATPFQVCWGGEIFTTKLSAQVLLISQPEPLLTYGEPWMGLLTHSCLAQITWYVIHPAFKALGSPH